MSRYSGLAWRAIAIVAFAGTAALAVVLTRPPPMTNPDAVACQAAGLDAWLGVGAGAPAAGSLAAGSLAAGSPVAGDVSGVPRTGATSSPRAGAYFTLEFTNVSKQACTLYGYPRVWAYAGGHLIGSPAVVDPSIRPSTVMLAPDATAHAILHLTATDEAMCREVTVPELRVGPPQGGAQLVPLSIPACSRAGIEFLSVEAVQPRAGIPGFPRY